MFCPKCGKENSDENKFCDKCGESLKAGAKKKASAGKIVLPIILVVCIGIVSAIALLGGDKYVKLVKGGTLTGYPQIAMEEVLGNYVSNIEWTEQVSDSYQVVFAKGMVENKPYEVQFWVEPEENQFEVLMITAGGEVYSLWKESLEIELWYIDYAKIDQSVDFRSDVVADFLECNLADLYNIFEYEYELLGTYMGSTIIQFAQDNCPYIFCMDPYSYYSEAIWDDSAVLGVMVGTEGTVINEEIALGMTYEEIQNTVKRGMVGEIGWNEMEECWGATITYDRYEIQIQFVNATSMSDFALIKAI